METLRRFLLGLVDLLLGFLAVMGEVAVNLNAEFAWGLPAELVRFVGFLVGGLVVFGGIARLILYKPRANKPQSIVLKTTETPLQVLSQDIRNFFFVLLRIGVVLALLWFALRSGA